MAKISVGIVGLGWVSTGHMIAFNANPDVEVTAVCSSREWDKEKLAKIYGPNAKLYRDYNAFLAHPGLQVVDICSEHRMHAEQAIKAAEAGKHVMIEKPICLDYASLERVKDAVKKSGVKSAVYFELRYIPHFEFIKNAIATGLIGDVHHLEVDYYHGIGPWYGQYGWNVKKDRGGSSILTAGIHALDALLYFKNQEVEEVYAYSTKSSAPILKEYEYDTTAVSIIKFKDGSVGKCASCIDARQPYLFNIHISASEGAIWNDKLWSTKLKGINAANWIEIPTVQAESGDVLAHPYGPQVDEFIGNIQTKKDSSVNFDEAYKTHRVAFAIEQSLVEKHPIRLSELR
jgi:predicted dehydrogenase